MNVDDGELGMCFSRGLMQPPPHAGDAREPECANDGHFFMITRDKIPRS
jgi:hypothetical protein